MFISEFIGWFFFCDFFGKKKFFFGFTDFEAQKSIDLHSKIQSLKEKKKKFCQESCQKLAKFFEKLVQKIDFFGKVEKFASKWKS